MIPAPILKLLRLRPRPRAIAPAVPWSLERLGSEFPSYRRTFAFDGEFLNASHREIAAWPVEGDLVRGPVPGFLRMADALALYELAYGSRGSVLEMGSAWGLSTTILCRGVSQSRRRARVVSIEIEPAFHQATVQAVASQDLTRVYHAVHGDAAVESQRLIGEGCTFGFAFVDHDHAYEPTRMACRSLARLLKPGGFALFHDFNDVRNRLEPDTYGVHRGVVEALDDPSWQFLGVIGCCALLRRTDRR